MIGFSTPCMLLLMLSILPLLLLLLLLVHVVADMARLPHQMFALHLHNLLLG
jgi:hypothetical protein